MVISLSGGLVKLHLQYCVNFWHLQYKAKIDMMERVQWRAIKMIREWKHQAQELAESWGVFSLEKKILTDNLISVFVPT